MEIKEIEVDEFSNIETMNICYNCTHASSGSKTVICMGGTPWIPYYKFPSRDTNM
jgi:hypothetical protein